MSVELPSLSIHTNFQHIYSLGKLSPISDLKYAQNTN